MNHGKQPLSTLLWQAFYQHAQRETQINVLFIDSDPAVRLSLCGPVRLVVWAWLLAFFFCMSECVCLCLAVLWMDGNHAGMLYPGPKSLDMLLLGLARLAFWRTHTGLPPCLSLMWTWDEACCPLLWRKKILLILNNEHWTAQWPTWIICMAAYLRYDNRARCPGWFKQTSDEFHPIGIA